MNRKITIQNKPARINLKFFNAEEIKNIAKCTVHISGKLGFSSGAVKLFKITESKSIQIAQNEEDETDQNLYAIINDFVKPGAFKINKAGQYYYVNTKNLFDELGIDYKSTKVVYDITKADYEGTPIIKMTKR